MSVAETSALLQREGSARMETMWKDLPVDILETVIVFLPLVSVCRFRTVSKIWNRFISHPDFAARHARASPPGEYVLITMRYGILSKVRTLPM